MRTFAKRSALVLATLLALFAALEVATRTLSDVDPRLTVADPEVGRRPRGGDAAALYDQVVASWSDPSIAEAVD